MAVDYITKVDESRTHYDSGAQRSGKTGKGRYDLWPVEAKRRVSIKYQQGAEAYGERNWEKGIPYSSLIDSAQRHIDQFLDRDSTEDHLAAAVWNLNALMHFEKWRPDLDNRPSRDLPPAVTYPEPGENTKLPQYVGIETIKSDIFAAINKVDKSS